MIPRTLQFHHATVIYTDDFSQATGRKMPKLYVQIIDSYRYQREWTLQLRHKPGDSKILFWESHIYKHPGRREICELGEHKAKALMEHFFHLCQEYPSLLFSTEDKHPLHEGFVHFAEQLHDGEEPSKSML